MVYIKKLKGGKIIISNKQKMKGGGLKVKNFKDMIKATYKTKSETPEIIGDSQSLFYLDDGLSTDEVKVYYNPGEDQAVVAVRGTDTSNKKDIFTDVKLAFGRFNNERFNSAKKVLDDVINFYHNGLGFKIDVIGHSLGGKVAFQISRNRPNDRYDTSLRPEINNVITLNSAGSLAESFTKNPENKYDVRSTNDVVSELTPEPYVNPETEISNNIDIDANQYSISSPSATINYGLQEHTTDILDRLPDQEMIIGSGNRRKKTEAYHIQAVLFNNDKWTSNNAREWLKQNNLNPIERVQKAEKYHRYRITTPNQNKYEYRILRTNKNVDFIIGFKKQNHFFLKS